MAYANAVPWHGLGARVDEQVTVDEMLVAAGLDWTVDKVPLWGHTEDGKKFRIPGRYALTRSTDRRVLTLTGEQWKPLQNRDALEFFRSYSEAGGITLETAGSLRNGKVIWGLARIGHNFQVTPGDHVQGYLLLVSPHEVGSCISVRTTTVRVVCANTMAMAMRSQGEVHWRQNHMRDFDADAAKAAVAIAHDQLRIAEQQAKTLQKLKLSINDTVRTLAPFFQPKIKELAEAEQVNPANWTKQFGAVMASVVGSPGATPDNAWGVLNGVTHWADHVAGRSPDTRMLRAWMGETARLKVAVNTKLLELAA
jgi:phage/plasmid-like protein (TIGR03299 family)